MRVSPLGGNDVKEREQFGSLEVQLRLQRHHGYEQPMMLET